jgi:hypothetical protein
VLKMKGALGVYVGYERYTDEPNTFSRAWFRELADPWRVGSGLRIRFGHRAVQVGRYRINTEGDMNALKQLGGRELPVFRPEEIGRWNGQGVRLEEPDPGPPAA